MRSLFATGISSDRKWQLHKGTKLQCQRFVDSFADRDAIGLSIVFVKVVDKWLNSHYACF